MCLKHFVIVSSILIFNGPGNYVVGKPKPDFWDIFKRSNWVDKLPSVEVKFGQTGVTVSTGPSREELYWTIGYVVGGVLGFILLLFALGFCIKILSSRRRPSREVIVRDIPMMSMNPNQYGHGISDARLITPTILSSNYPGNASRIIYSHPDDNSSSSRYDPINQRNDRRNDLYNYNRNKFEKESMPTAAAETPPPPYRSTR